MFGGKDSLIFNCRYIPSLRPEGLGVGFRVYGVGFGVYGFLWDPPPPKQVFPYLVGPPPDYSDPHLLGGGGGCNQNPPLRGFDPKLKTLYNTYMKIFNETAIDRKTCKLPCRVQGLRHVPAQPIKRVLRFRGIPQAPHSPRVLFINFRAQCRCSS